MGPSVQAFEVSSEDEIRTVLGRLEQALDGRSLPEVAERRRYLDTFDWRIYRAGAWLSESSRPGKVQLSWSMNGAAPSTVQGTRSPKEAGDLPEGPLREDLAQLVAPRALQPVAEVLRRSRTVELLDVEHKVVARVTATSCEYVSIPDAPPTFRLVLEGVRGYDDEYQAAYRFLRYQLSLAVPEGREIDAILKALPDGAGRDPSRLDVALADDASTSEAVRAVLSGLWDVIDANREGVLANADTEFLHDLRVAVRRTRSVLGQVGDVLPRTPFEHYRHEFRWLGQATGEARDLDVLQLEFDAYLRDLPSGDAEALAPLRAAVASRRRTVQRNLRKVLDGDRYQKLEDTWKPFLAEPGGYRQSDDAGRPARQVIAERAWKRYRKVRRLGRRADGETPVEELHELRIQAKKLRYLLELFRELYPASRFGACVKSLKQIQTCLGDLNDTQVHGGMVREFAGRAGRKQGVEPEALVAAGMLVSALAARTSDHRKRFLTRFETFASDATDEAFKKLLKARKR